MKVNIVMLAHNRETLTRQALMTLYDNTPNDLFNLTFVDDGSAITQKVNVPAEGSSNSCTLRIEDSKGITGQARNLGIYWAEKYWGRGDYLYLSDNDMYFTPGWLEKLIAASNEVCLWKFAVIGGWNHPFLQPKSTEGTHGFSISMSSGNSIWEHDAVAGASQLMRWSVWDKYGPLDAHAVGVGQSEDWKFCQDIIKDGGRVGSVYPRVVLNCGITNSFGNPSPGADVMLKELQEAKLKYSDIFWE